MADPFHVDVRRLNAYLSQDDPPGDVPSARELLQTAYNAFLAAGILKIQSRTITPDAPMTVEDVGVTLKYDRKTLYWSPDRVPSVEGVIAGLAHHLAAVVNQPPTPGPWPKQLDAE
jgi:hypothetical protein